MKILIGSAGGIFTVIMLVWIIGLLLPEKHRATVEQIYHVPPEELWRVLIDIPAYPHWRSDITAVTKMPSEKGYDVWQELGNRGDTVAYATVESKPNKLLVRKIVTPGLPYGGRWSIRLEPREQGSKLTIVEDGEIYSALFRFMSRYVFGHSASIKKFMGDLEGALK